MLHFSFLILWFIRRKPPPILMPSWACACPVVTSDTWPHGTGSWTDSEQQAGWWNEDSHLKHRDKAARGWGHWRRDVRGMGYWGIQPSVHLGHPVTQDGFWGVAIRILFPESHPEVLIHESAVIIAPPPGDSTGQPGYGRTHHIVGLPWWLSG